MAGGASGHRDSNGAWVADPPPGYYGTDGRWNQGAAYGYYDNRGRWVPTRGQYYQGMPHGTIAAQLNWLDSYISSTAAVRSLSRGQLRSARQELRSIFKRERNMRHDRQGNLSPRDRAELQQQIDRLTNRLQITQR